MSTSTEPASADETKKMQLDVKVESPHACLREIVVTVPESEVKRYLKDAYDDLVTEAQVPGFRSGRAPRKLVEKQFRERVMEQVKGSLLMDSLAQVTEDADFSAISEPNFDFEAIDFAEEGDFKFQFSVEVRPEFETPAWEGIDLEKPVEQISDDEITKSLDKVLHRFGESEPTDQPAELGDVLVVNAVFYDGDTELSRLEEDKIELREILSMSDSSSNSFGESMVGVKEGETRTVKVKVGDSAAEEYRGKEVDGKFSVVEVIRYTKPELTPAFLDRIGGFEAEDDLRSFVRDSLERQARYRTQQAVRESIVKTLAASAEFELPPDLVRRQANREFERKVLEMRRNGLTDDVVQQLSNLLRQNAQATTEAALREHFILEQIAEKANVEAEPEDFEAEIQLIADQEERSIRSVRAKLEKSGQMDSLRNQIVERKVLEMIEAKAKVKEVTPEPDESDTENTTPIRHAVAPPNSSESIPEAMHDDHKVPGAEEEKDQANDKD